MDDLKQRVLKYRNSIGYNNKTSIERKILGEDLIFKLKDFKDLNNKKLLKYYKENKKYKKGKLK